jgi:hypothetical protein
LLNTFVQHERGIQFVRSAPLDTRKSITRAERRRLYAARALLVTLLLRLLLDREESTAAARELALHLARLLVVLTLTPRICFRSKELRDVSKSTWS